MILGLHKIEDEPPMKTIRSTLMALLILLTSAALGQGKDVVKLPAPAHKGTLSVEEALQRRRTVRHFASRSLTLNQVSQLLWGADGVSDPRGFRTAPSAGATYPLELYLVVGERGVEDLAPGLYRYLPQAHALEPTGAKGDLRALVARTSLYQSWMAEAPVMVVIAAEYRRVGAFEDRALAQILQLPANHEPLLVMPVGYKY